MASQPFDMLRVGPQEEGARRQSSPSTGKLSARPAGKPGSSIVKESLRRSLRRHSVPVTCRHSEAPQMRFRRHAGIYPSDGGAKTQAWARSHCLPPAAPNPSPRTCREDRALLIVRMSSDRLFLDRVARQHCPSPLHRHAQINMHSPAARGKGDISTLP